MKFDCCDESQNLGYEDNNTSVLLNKRALRDFDMRSRANRSTNNEDK